MRKGRLAGQNKKGGWILLYVLGTVRKKTSHNFPHFRETQRLRTFGYSTLLNILPLRARGIAYAQGVTGILHSKSRGIIPLKAIIAYRN